MKNFFLYAALMTFFRPFYVGSCVLTNFCPIHHTMADLSTAAEAAEYAAFTALIVIALEAAWRCIRRLT